MSAPEDAWLEAFHAGSGAALERCYRAHFADVRAAVGKILQGADRDTVTHHVFYRLVSEPSLRQNFRGGNFAAWLARVAHNEAFDFRRRYSREAPPAVHEAAASGAASADDSLDAKMLVERFRRDHLPPKLDPLFERRFLRQLSQREAAQELGIRRSTLAYQEQQIRDALRLFLLGEP